MAGYHIHAGCTGIYAGMMGRNDAFWTGCQERTDEAVEAVRDWIMYKMLGGTDAENVSGGYTWTMPDGRVIELVVAVSARPKHPPKLEDKHHD